MKFFLSLLLLAVNGFAAQSASSPENQEKQADPFIREYNRRLARNPEGLLFTVRLKDNRKQFHLGEMITLELSFAASKPNTFTLDAATYDRSGRLHSDGFAFDKRDAVVDPIADYFNSGLDGFIMGGLRGIPDLTDKPYLITADVNEWQRIDKPGHYRLYVVSSRVGRSGGGRTFLDNASSPVVSNVIEFDILPPDKKWATQKLKETIAVLSKPDGDHTSACRTLRFLGTAAAVSEMRKRFRGDDNKCEWEYKFGLIGSPHRALVIRDMENAISLREQPVTSHFISTLALLEFIRQAPAAPPYPNGTDEQAKQWRIQMDQRRSVYDKLRLNYVRQLAMAIPQKQGQARATSLQTLLDYRSEVSASDFSQWSGLLAFLPEVFNRLPLDDQLRLLKYQWKPISSQAMLPVLREVLKYSYSPKDDTLEGSFNVFEQQDLRGTALLRLYELSPEEGRRLLLDEIRRAKPRVDREVLRSLPDETLPELNAVLLNRLEESYRTGNWLIEIDSELIERYATDEILSRVQAVYEGRDAGKWECVTQAALLAYFLRVAPSVGGDYLKNALAARDKGFPRCYRETLKKVADLHMSSEVEEIAIAALDDEDSEVMSKAASVLAEYGSAGAEKALWQRLEKWHEAMQSRGEELGKQDAMEEALRVALTKGQGWLFDPEKLKRLRDVCLTESSRNEVDRMIRDWNPQIYIDVNSLDGVWPRIGVAHYELKSLDSLKKKLLQFPKGTEFKLKTAPTRGDDPQSESVFKQIEGYLEEHGMKLKRVPEPELRQTQNENLKEAARNKAEQGFQKAAKKSILSITTRVVVIRTAITLLL
jgi:hypothetical protein